jgi:hypothetical protein
VTRESVVTCDKNEIKCSLMNQAKEEARQAALDREADRKAAIVAAERAKLLRGAAHLRAYLPRRDALDIDALVGPAV